MSVPRSQNIETEKSDVVVDLANIDGVVEDLDTACVIGVDVLGTVAVMLDCATSELGYRVGWNASAEMSPRAGNN